MHLAKQMADYKHTKKKKAQQRVEAFIVRRD